MSFWPKDIEMPLVPLKYVCSIDPEILPESTNPERQLKYVDIGNVTLQDGITGYDAHTFREAPSRARKIVRAGDTIVSTVRTYLRAIAYIDRDAPDYIVSTGFAVIRPRASVDPRYLHRVLQSAPFVESVVAHSTGVSYPAITSNKLGELAIPLPDLRTQRRIADFLDRETGRIDELIAGKERLVGLVPPKWEAIIHDARRHSNWVRFGYVSERLVRPVAREESKTYTALGLFNRGRGLFHKDPVSGNELGESDFNWVHSGDLILSGQFAWEGAVAMAGPDEMKTVVSHRYPLYRGAAGVDTAYLFAYLRTEPGDFILNECSRGAAGRNRPLNTTLLEKEKIPVPPIDVQKKVSQLIAVERTLKATVEKSAARLRELRAALITAAVTGQIDVGTWRQRAETERRIDEIEAEKAGV